MKNVLSENCVLSSSFPETSQLVCSVAEIFRTISLFFAENFIVVQC